jgi:hypothetical protein
MNKITMRSLIIFLLLFSFTVITQAQKQIFPESLILTPEKSNFEKTSTHTDVMNFITSIQPLTNYMHVGSIGKSTMGKDIPMVVLANPKISSPAEAKASGKPVIYIQGNIHAGEVEGKEVTMMLMRDILVGDQQALLKNQIIIFVPIYNTDGNDKMAKGLRPTQENSPLETGERENGQGLDLNRDGIKMEAPETAGLIQNLITAWDPQVSVDLHTTNGTWHGYSLTWAPGYLSSGQPGPYHFVNDQMLPFITNEVKEKNGLYFGPFGDYNTREAWPPKNFYTYNHHPRYLINQFGLRNRMSILSEAFAHERFYQRINTTYNFVYQILSYTNTHAQEILRINKEAENAAIKNIIDNAGKIQKGVRFKMVPTNKPLAPFKTYDYIRYKKADGSTALLKTGRVVQYDSVTYYAAFKDTVQATLPRGYIIPAAFANIAEHVKKHGATVTQLEKKTIFEGEQFVVEKFTKATRKFEGHFMASAEGKYERVEKTAEKGDYIIDLAQPLANLIFYMLEPQSDDGLLLWNFFDTYFETNNVATQPVVYPIFKYFGEKSTGKKRK